jgi:hypothetical protein
MRLTYKPFQPIPPAAPPPPPVEPQPIEHYYYYVQDDDAGKFVMIFIAGAIAMAILDSLK